METDTELPEVTAMIELSLFDKLTGDPLGVQEAIIAALSAAIAAGVRWLFKRFGTKKE